MNTETDNGQQVRSNDLLGGSLVAQLRLRAEPGAYVGTTNSLLMQQAANEIERLRETLLGIANADWRRWEELASPDEFVRWAKSRALHALTPNT